MSYGRHFSTSTLVFSGRAAALFALLAGVGLALSTGGERPRMHPRRAVAAADIVNTIPGTFTLSMMVTPPDLGGSGPPPRGETAGVGAHFADI